MNKRVGIIGYGTMGAAIAERIKSVYQPVVFDKDTLKTSGATGVRIAGSIGEAVTQSDVVILAVKPQDFEKVLAEIKPQAAGRLIISIAAGVPTAVIEKHLDNARVVRSMPNLPARIGKGMTAVAKGKSATAADLELALELFRYVGTVMEVAEKMMDAITAVSGSGPGFLFHLLAGKPDDEWEFFAQHSFMPALAQAAQKVGFSAREATILASVTTAGSMAVVKETRLTPDALCSQVASKGGTTEAGLHQLQGNVTNLEKAVIAARDRAKELTK